MLRPRVEHMVEEAYAGPYPDVLRGCYLRGMVGGCLWGNGGVGRGEIFVGEDVGFREVVEGTAI